MSMVYLCQGGREQSESQHNEKVVLVCHWTSERNWPRAIMQFIRAVLGNPLPVLLAQND